MDWEQMLSGPKLDYTTKPFQDAHMAFSIDTLEAVFPFITTCLAVGTALSDEKVHRFLDSMIHLLSIKTTYKQTDNNEGFTILDTTTPGNTRHAFFFYAAREVEPDYDALDDDPDNWPEELIFPEHTLLGPKTYARATAYQLRGRGPEANDD
ncbi:uncharacterized protein LTR77_007815 [Saxophila tyrrhenica]|uniref:Uncharacterized protein n=1 Tax=Saxophila tyrrhenica TaxID=1690608 RepID=A0AAV9P3M2_9PEZI|nr:hypothetical protein LTR77_007815 [Saxophila tyrrhenica]